MLKATVEHRFNCTAADLMNSDVVRVTPEMTLLDAADRLLARRVSHAVVVEGREPKSAVGVLSTLEISAMLS